MPGIVFEEIIPLRPLYLAWLFKIYLTQYPRWMYGQNPHFNQKEDSKWGISIQRLSLSDEIW